MKSLFRSTRILAVALMAVAASMAVPALAQSAATVNALTPMTRDLGAIKTMTAQVAATVTSADQTGYNVSRVVCAYNQTTVVGTSPTVVFSIQNKDNASGGYYNVISSGTVTSATTMPVAISAGGGVATTANVGAGIPVARYWRVAAVVSGSTSVTGTIGCSVQ